MGVPLCRLLVSPSDTHSVHGIVECATGVTYLGLHQPVASGEIHKHQLTYTLAPDACFGEDGRAAIHFKVVRPVHANTVRALLRKTGKADYYLARRKHWHEVHGD